jgi:hypothetical protein
MRAYHSWVGAFTVGTRFEWATVPASQTVFVTGGGPLLISIDVSVQSGINQTFACRPSIDGLWAGAYGNHVNVPVWSEGAMTTYGSTGWVLWNKTRVYVGVPAGTHTAAVQCLRESSTTAITVGHSGNGVPGSLSVLEMHGAGE